MNKNSWCCIVNWFWGRRLEFLLIFSCCWVMLYTPRTSSSFRGSMRGLFSPCTRPRLWSIKNVMMVKFALNNQRLQVYDDYCEIDESQSPTIAVDRDIPLRNHKSYKPIGFGTSCSSIVEYLMKHLYFTIEKQLVPNRINQLSHEISRNLVWIRYVLNTTCRNNTRRDWHTRFLIFLVGVC